MITGMLIGQSTALAQYIPIGVVHVRAFFGGNLKRFAYATFGKRLFGLVGNVGDFGFGFVGTSSDVAAVAPAAAAEVLWVSVVMIPMRSTNSIVILPMVAMVSCDRNNVMSGMAGGAL